MHRIVCILLAFTVLPGLPACVQVTTYDQPAVLANVDSTHEPHRFLQTYLNFSEKDLLNMEQGEVVAKVFDMQSAENEVGAFGVVRLNIPKGFFVEQFRDIVSFTESDAVLQIGKFSPAPSLEDIQELTIDPRDIKDLRDCQPGDCKVKIDTEMMARFQNEVDWSAPDYEDQVTRMMQQMLVEYTKAYLEHGDAALGEYHDQDQPLCMAEAFGELLENSPYLSEYVPELYAYLRDFPDGELENVENFIYWSTEQFSLKPVINLFHVTIYQRKRGETHDVFITSKQIYASHYFETSLGFTAFVDEVGGENPQDAYLMYLNRSRFDQLRGKLKGVIVALAKHRVYDGVKMYFRHVKKRLETGQIAENSAH